VFGNSVAVIVGLARAYRTVPRATTLPGAAPSAPWPCRHPRPRRSIMRARARRRRWPRRRPGHAHG
jgi:hypothetical protein